MWKAKKGPREVYHATPSGCVERIFENLTDALAYLQSEIAKGADAGIVWRETR